MLSKSADSALDDESTAIEPDLTGQSRLATTSLPSTAIGKSDRRESAVQTFLPLQPEFRGRRYVTY